MPAVMQLDRITVDGYAWSAAIQHARLDQTPAELSPKRGAFGLVVDGDIVAKT